MLGFEQTETGYRATDEQIAWWESRDTCPMCGAVVEPFGVTADGLYRYGCGCDLDEPITWTRKI